MEYNNVSLDNHNYDTKIDDNLIGKILNEKLNRIRDTIRLIKVLIAEREKINEKVIEGLNFQILHARNLILKAEPIIPGYTKLTSVQADLEKEIFKLEKAKLDEEVTSWRDVLGLKKNLIDLIKQLKAAENKARLFKP